MVLKVIALIATALLAWCVYKFSQDPRYVMRDPFMLILTGAAGVAALLAWLAVWLVGQ